MKNFKFYKIAIMVVLVLVIILAVVIFKRKPLPKIGIKGKVAIVLDDWGYNLNNVNILRELPYPLSISILPNLVYSQRIAYQAHQLGFEVMLHLPLEPHEKYRLERYTITHDMDENTILKILKLDLAQCRFFKGINNHMGSKATEDSRILGIIFRELKKHHMYFLDSFTTSKSMAAQVATSLDVPFARRDIFLDNKEDAQYIRGQLDKLKMIARTQGYAIGIGHDRNLTLKILKEIMPKMEKEGFRFVFVSKLINLQRQQKKVRIK
jgi:hypothetical protein